MKYKEDLQDLLLAIVIVITVGFSVVVVPASVFDRIACSNYSEMTGRDTKFLIIGGCYLDHGGRMIPKDEYKFIELREGE